jgi:hypothetical protein
MMRCQICDREFEDRKELHKHIKSEHSVLVKDYYVAYYPRKCPYSGLTIEYKNYDEYFSTFFFCDKYADDYFRTKWNTKEARDLTIEIFRNRIEKKKLLHAPTYLELKSLQLPSLKLITKMFGSYGELCKIVGIPLLFKNRMPAEFNNDYSNVEILIDTREQRPLTFNNCREVKLDTGDYTAGGEFFTHTFVDRKSEGDFKGTLSGGYERFRRELTRCRELGVFMFIVVEAWFEDLERNNRFKPHRCNLDYVLHNMRTLQHDFYDCCQFVFSGNRSNSQRLIPKLVALGDKVWGVDIQYYLEN